MNNSGQISKINDVPRLDRLKLRGDSNITLLNIEVKL